MFQLPTTLPWFQLGFFPLLPLQDWEWPSVFVQYSPFRLQWLWHFLLAMLINTGHSHFFSGLHISVDVPEIFIAGLVIVMVHLLLVSQLPQVISDQLLFLCVCVLVNWCNYFSQPNATACLSPSTTQHHSINLMSPLPHTLGSHLHLQCKVDAIQNHKVIHPHIFTTITIWPIVSL